MAGIRAALLVTLLGLFGSAFAADTAPILTNTTCGCTFNGYNGTGFPLQRHVLLISVDGFHTFDLATYIASNPNSTMASLAKTGYVYSNVTGSKPSDSFPGLIAEVTGGTPKTTGIWYDDAYDRSLSPPGSKCNTTGTEVLYAENLDFDPTSVDFSGGIDPSQLPLDPKKNCTPVYPHSYIRVNTIFEVVKAHGGYTAWSDKHPAYDILNGPSGKGVDDLYAPEIQPTPKTFNDTRDYDERHARAILNWINGTNAFGNVTKPIPNLMGANFQVLNVAETIPNSNGGFLTPPPVDNPNNNSKAALDYVDQTLGRFVSALSSKRLLYDTTIILTAKHGNQPVGAKSIDIPAANVTAVIQTATGDTKEPAQITTDDVALIWLRNAANTQKVVNALNAQTDALGIDQVLSGDSVKPYGDPTTDSRAPDIIIITKHLVIYSKSAGAQHGGFGFEDTSEALLISNPRFDFKNVTTPVNTTQIAGTVLKILGLDPYELNSTAVENNKVLPTS